MGSMINLGVGRLETDWGKNSFFNDHSALYQVADLVQVPHFYPGDEEFLDDAGLPRREIVTIYKDGLSKPLPQIINRIELLGHSLAQCENEFAHLAKLFDIKGFPFAHLKDAVARVDIGELSLDYGDSGDDLGEFVTRQIFPRLGLSAAFKDQHGLRYAASQAMENLSPYTILQLSCQ